MEPEQEQGIFTTFPKTKKGGKTIPYSLAYDLIPSATVHSAQVQQIIDIMVAGEIMENQDHILTSSYPNVPFPTSEPTSAVEYILTKVKRNVDNGLTRWVTNSVTGEEIWFAEIEPLSRKVASTLRKRGMKKGSVAIYLTSDVTRIYPIILGAWRSGGIMYSSYPEDTSDAVLQRVLDSNAQWIFCDPDCVEQCNIALEKVEWKVEIFVFGEVNGTTPVDQLFLDDGAACPEKVPCSDLDDPILVLCTSGTMGRSKGAVYTNRSLLGICHGTMGLPLTSNPVMLLLRSTHVLGLLFPMRNACRGHWVVMMDDLSKQNILKCVQNYKPDFAFGFPTFLLALAIDPQAKQYDLSSLDAVCTGGMVIPETFYSTMLKLPNIKHVMNGYGLTECAAVATTIDLQGNPEYTSVQDQPKLTVGRLYPNVSLQVCDLETGNRLGPTERGELLVRSPIMASGYWANPKDTSEAFVDGWFKTGDLGYYDEQGFVYIVDRIKETFKYFNNHISPAELESDILKHPGVAEASVFGVIDPNGGDHIPRALVVLKPGSKVTSREIRDFADGNLADYKRLRGGVFIVDKLPKGNTGKIVRSVAATIRIPPIAY